MNGWNTHQSWRLATTIHNTEQLNNEAWFVCEDYRQGKTTLSEAIDELYKLLLDYRTRINVSFGYADIKEFILSH